jgi:hypothetical protein
MPKPSPVIAEKTLSVFSHYVFRSDGEVVSLWNNPRILVGGVDKDGYRKLILIDDAGCRRYVRHASVICEAFHGTRPHGNGVRHLDGNRKNDKPFNLKWGTQKENCADKKLHGTEQCGEKNGNHKLTKQQVLYIKTHTEFSCRSLAKIFSMSFSGIWAIRKGRCWAWLS